TDDLRDAPALTIARMLLERGASVVAYDPMAMARARSAEIVSGLEVTDTVEAALTKADAAILVTEWSEFSTLDWADARRLMRQAIIVDGRNVLDDAAMVEAGFRYTGFGRGFALPAPTSIVADRDLAAVAEGS